MSEAGLKLIDTAFGLQVIYGGRRLYGECPIPDIERRIESIRFQKDTLYILPSPVVCHGVPMLLRLLPPGSAILAIEADPILMELCGRFWRDLPVEETRAQLVAATPESVGAAIDRWGLRRFRRVLEIGLTGGSSFHRNTYRNIRERLDRDIRIGWQNRLTLTAMGRLWMRNIFRNLPTAESFAEVRQGSATSDSRPAVVCGAGPSLNDFLPWLLRVRDAVIVVAADTALPALVQRGITPDAVVALEGQLANIGDFLPAQGLNYTLYADLTSSPAVVESHKPGQVAWLLSEFAELSILDRIRSLPLPIVVIPPLGSVGVASLVVASQITTGNIFLSGLDMSIRPGETHARGTAPHRALLTATARTRGLGGVGVGAPLIRSKTAAGRMAETTVAMLGYAEELRRIVGELGRVCAVAESGLPSGAKLVSVDEAEQMIRAVHPVSHREAAEQENDPDGVPPKGSTIDGVERFIEDEMSRLSRLAEHLAEHLSGEYDRSVELADELNRNDYVCVDFPDSPSNSKLETSFLRRTLIAAGYYMNRLQVASRGAR